AGHLRVEEDEIGTFPPRDGESFSAARRGHDPVREALLDLLTDFSEQSRVVDQEYGRHGLVEIIGGSLADVGSAPARCAGQSTETTRGRITISPWETSGGEDRT